MSELKNNGNNNDDSKSVPVIDISPLINLCNASKSDLDRVANDIYKACSEWGFFYIINHNISIQLQSQLEAISKQFFALPIEEKMKIRMELGGRAWRGYFPVNGELTSGKPGK